MAVASEAFDLATRRTRGYDAHRLCTRAAIGCTSTVDSTQTGGGPTWTVSSIDPDPANILPTDSHPPSVEGAADGPAFAVKLLVRGLVRDSSHSLKVATRVRIPLGLRTYWLVRGTFCPGRQSSQKACQQSCQQSANIVG